MLEEDGIKYEELSLSDYPEKRTDMLQLADRLSVPQIFVNGHHLGGASELATLREDGKLQALLDQQPHERANDPRLKRPDYEPQVVSLPEAPPELKTTIAGEGYTYDELVKVLTGGVEARDHTHHLKKQQMCFAGKELAAFLSSHFKLRPEEALETGRDLARTGVFSAADGSGRDFSADGALFRFQVHEQGMWKALNNLRQWCHQQVHEQGHNLSRRNSRAISEAPSDPLGVLKRLKGQLGDVLKPHTDKEGMIDYLAVGEDDAFRQFELAVGELQSVNLIGMESSAKRAFVINLYNMIIPHAFARVGIASGDLPRVAFFDGVRYSLGGHMYSLNDLENGVLRANRNPPYHMRRPFRGGDPRAEAAEPAHDHRIHFALNCGAKSCPPVKWFTPGALDEELRIVAMAWVEQDDNVRVDVAAKTLWLSMICQWYSADFGATKQQVAATLLAHSRGEKKEQLQQLLAGQFSLKHSKYDWSVNSARSAKYSKVCLSAFFG